MITKADKSVVVIVVVVVVVVVPLKLSQARRTAPGSARGPTAASTAGSGAQGYV